MRYVPWTLVNIRYESHDNTFNKLTANRMSAMEEGIERGMERAQSHRREPFKLLVTIQLTHRLSTFNSIWENTRHRPISTKILLRANPAVLASANWQAMWKYGSAFMGVDRSAQLFSFLCFQMPLNRRVCHNTKWEPMCLFYAFLLCYVARVMTYSWTFC